MTVLYIWIGVCVFLGILREVLWLTGIKGKEGPIDTLAHDYVEEMKELEPAPVPKPDPYKEVNRNYTK